MKNKKKREIYEWCSVRMEVLKVEILYGLKASRPKVKLFVVVQPIDEVYGLGRGMASNDLGLDRNKPNQVN